MKAPRKLLPKPFPVAVQDATLPRNMYRGGASPGQAKAGSLGVKLARKALPINGAMVLQDLTGNKTPLTEKDLTPEEVGVLRKGARSSFQYNPSAGPKEMGYTNYGEDGMALPGVINKGLPYMIGTPQGRMATTIGGATLNGTPSNANLTDRFEFDNHFDKGGDPMKGQGESWSTYSPYEKLRFLAEKYGTSKEGAGIPVNINLGNLKRPTPLETSTKKYSQGTQAVMATPPKRKLKAKSTTDPYQGETSEPTVKPTPIPSDGEMDQVLAENPSPAYKMPSLAPASSGSGLAKGGTEAVAAYQRKLNSMGANLTVDGAWGGKTQAAFDQYQGKSAPKASIRKAPKEVVSGFPGGDIAGARAQEDRERENMEWAQQGAPKIKDYTKIGSPASPIPAPTKRKVSMAPKPTSPDNDPDPWTPEKQALTVGSGLKTTDDWYSSFGTPEKTSPSGQKTKAVGSGYQIYPNGRVLTPGGKVRQGPTLPRRKLATGK